MNATGTKTLINKIEKQTHQHHIQREDSDELKKGNGGENVLHNTSSDDSAEKENMFSRRVST